MALMFPGPMYARLRIDNDDVVAEMTGRKDSRRILIDGILDLREPREDAAWGVGFILRKSMGEHMV